MAAALNNFEGVQKAYTLAMDSAGSATEENARYMESIEAHVQNLKATFQDFARNVFNEEFVKRILDTANALLEFVNTPFGQAATRITLLSTAMFGLGGILKGYWQYFVQGSTIAKSIKDVVSAMKSVSGPGVTGMERFASLFTNLPLSLGQVGALAAGITALVLVVKALADSNEKANRSMADFDEEIGNANDQLEQNKSRLEEINQLSWKERTPEIIKEKQALEEENDELEKQIELLKEQKVERAERGTGEGFQFGYTKGTEAYDTMLSYLANYNDELQRTGEISDENRLVYDKTVSAAANQVEMLKVLKDAGQKLTDQEEQLIAAYDEHMRILDRVDDAEQTLIDSFKQLATTGYLNEEQYKRLISLYPELTSAITKTADGYTMQLDALYNLMSAESRQTALIRSLVSGFIEEQKQTGATKIELLNLVKAQIQASNTGLNFSQQIQALKQLATAAGYTADYVNNVLGAGLSETNIRRTAAGYMQQPGNTMTYEQALAKARSEAQKSLEYQWGKLTSTAPSTDWSADFGGGVYPSTADNDAAGKALQKEKDAIQDVIDEINDKYDAEVKAIEKEKDAIQDTIDEIKEAYNDQIDALEQEQDAVQETIDAINAKYDAQLDALEKYNDELEDEIELQQILEEMAKAKSTKKMVYKDGRFQYVEDLDAVAAAQTKLDEYNRKQALKKQKADIEEQRQLELKAYEDKKALLEQEQAVIEKRYELEIKSYESNKKLLEKEKENIERRRENELASYNEQKKLLEQQIKALQDYGDTYVDTVNSIGNNINDAMSKQNEQLKKRLEELQALLDDYNNTNKSKTPLTDAAREEAETLTPEQRAVYDMWKSRGVGSEEAMRQAKKTTSSSTGGSKPSLEKPSSKKNLQQRLAGGTTSAYGGMTLVGESGPELRVLNQGDGVLPANITRNLWAMATNPNLRFGRSISTKNTAISVANITLPNVRNAEEFVSGLKNMAYQRAYARA